MLPWTCGWSDDRLNEEINLHKTLFKILYSILYIFFLSYFFGKCSLKLQITKKCVYFLCTFLEHVSRNFSYTKDTRSQVASIARSGCIQNGRILVVEKSTLFLTYIV